MAAGDLNWCYTKAVALYDTAEAAAGARDATAGDIAACLELLKFIEQMPDQQ